MFSNFMEMNLDDLVKSKISPSRLSVTGGDEPCTLWYRVQGRGNKYLGKFLILHPYPNPIPSRERWYF
jgi:hypothetical protein